MRKIGILLLTFVLVFGQVQTIAYGETTSEKLKKAQQEKAQAQEKLEETKGQIGQLQSGRAALVQQLSDLNDDLTEVSEKLSAIEDRLVAKEEEIFQTTNRLVELNEEMDRLSQKLEDKNAEIDSQYDFMKYRICHVYRQGEDNYLDVILRAESFGDILNHAIYVEKATEYDQQLLLSMKEKRDELSQMKAETETKAAEIEEIKAQQEKEREEIQALKDEAAGEQDKVQGLVSKTTSGISGLSGQLKDAEKAAEDYESEIAQKNEDIKKLEAELEKERALAAKSRSMTWKDLSQIHVAEGERDLLACLIYCEAGGEPYEGQVAVGAVVMNRCMSGAFPDTITGVIYQSGQFSPVASGRLATRLAQGAPENCYKAADEALAGNSPVGNCLFFRTVIPQIQGQIIGNHVFYNPEKN